MAVVSPWSARKRPRLDPRHFGGDASESISALAAPVTAPTPSLPSAPVHGNETTANYWRMSIPELRAQLGFVGTNTALDWEKAEFVAVLQELDSIFMPDGGR